MLNKIPLLNANKVLLLVSLLNLNFSNKKEQIKYEDCLYTMRSDLKPSNRRGRSWARKVSCCFAFSLVWRESCLIDWSRTLVTNPKMKFKVFSHLFCWVSVHSDVALNSSILSRKYSMTKLRNERSLKTWVAREVEANCTPCFWFSWSHSHSLCSLLFSTINPLV